jgi:hypothetical protein
MEGRNMSAKQIVGPNNIYHIRVKGVLDEKWADWFEGFVIASRSNGETLLSGAVRDQAALYGVLGKIHGLGLPLLLVVQTDCPCSSRNCPRRGDCRQCAAYHDIRGEPPYCFKTRTGWDRQCTFSKKKRK